MRAFTALLLTTMAVTPGTGQWRERIRLIQEQRSAQGVEVAQAQSALRDLVRGDAKLAARLDMPPPVAPVPGYGIVPQIVANVEVALDPRPREMSYSLAELATWVERERTMATALPARAATKPGDRVALVEDYRLRVENLRRIDQHLAYHTFWQQVAYDGRVARRLEVLDLYRAARLATDTQAVASAQTTPPTPVDESVLAARQRLRDEMAGFRPSRHLRIVHTSQACVLPLTIATDIDDDLFIDGFLAAVDETWNHAPAMLQAGLQLRLELVRRPTGAIYPEGEPTVGTAIDLTAHRRRFDAPFVLTTGATTTHVDHDAILVGPAPLSGRTLAHELGHLLGFGDGYARIYRGGDGGSGFDILEVTPFPETLMSTPERGVVTSEMVDRLVRAYLD